MIFCFYQEFHDRFPLPGLYRIQTHRFHVSAREPLILLHSLPLPVLQFSQPFYYLILSVTILITARIIATIQNLSLIHISEPTRRTPISYAVFCLKKKKK